MALSSSDIKNMTVKLATSQGLQSQLIGDLSGESNALEDVNGDISNTTEDTLDLFNSAADDQNQIDALNREISTVNEQRNIDNVAISDKAVNDVKEAEKDKQTRIHLKKFVDESGMCGMGMGMGNTYSECGAIDLTAEELLALKDELLDLGDSQETFDSNFEQVTNVLNEKLAESGSKCSTGKDEDGGTYLEIQRSDGSSVKIYDANGNGALDNKDYDFCQAIQQAQEIINKMNEKIAAINTKAQADVEANNNAADEKIEELKSKIAELEGTRDASLDAGNYNKDTVLPNLNDKADGIQSEYDADKTELGKVEDNIDELSKGISAAKEQQTAKEAMTASEETPDIKENEEPQNAAETDKTAVADSDEDTEKDKEKEAV